MVDAIAIAVLRVFWSVLVWVWVVYRLRMVDRRMVHLWMVAAISRLGIRISLLHARSASEYRQG